MDLKRIASMTVRRQSEQTIVLRAPEAVFAYPEPMLSYCTNLPNAALASGVVNLAESPRYGDLWTCSLTAQQFLEPAFDCFSVLALFDESTVTNHSHPLSFIAFILIHH